MNDESGPPITLSRQQLFEQVWKTPITRLSKQYGLSDVGLAKVCKKHEVPRPPRGHWARLAHGKPVHQPGLPEPSRTDLETVVIDPPARGLRASRVGSGDTSVASRPAAPPSIRVPVTLEAPHALVAQARRRFAGAKADAQGLVRPKGDANALDVKVAPESVDRALRILDALIKGLEGRGCSVSFGGSDQQPVTEVRVDGEAIPFSISEEVRREAREMTAAEKRRRERYSWSFGSPPYVDRPTGRLVLGLGVPRGVRFRQRWADGRKQRVEDLLGRIVEAMFELAASIKVHRKAQEEERLRWEAKQQERAEQERLAREEEARRAGLLADIEAWQTSRRIRAYVEEVTRRVRDVRGPGGMDAEFTTWVDWALLQADRFDPLIASPTSVPDAGP